MSEWSDENEDHGSSIDDKKKDKDYKTETKFPQKTAKNTRLRASQKGKKKSGKNDKSKKSKKNRQQQIKTDADISSVDEADTEDNVENNDDRQEYSDDRQEYDKDRQDYNTPTHTEDEKEEEPEDTTSFDAGRLVNIIIKTFLELQNKADQATKIRMQKIIPMFNKLTKAIHMTEEHHTKKINETHSMMIDMTKQIKFMALNQPSTEIVETLIQDSMEVNRQKTQDMATVIIKEIQEIKQEIALIHENIKEAAPSTIDGVIIDELKEIKEATLATSPITNEVQAAVRTANKQQAELLQTIARDLQENTARIASIQQIQTTTPNQDIEATQAGQSTAPTIGESKQRILIIKPKLAGQNRISGMEIYHRIESIDVGKISIEVTKPQRYSAEVHCYTSKDAQKLKSLFNSNSSLNTDLISSIKSPRLQRSILLDVPDYADEECLMTNMASQFEATIDELKIIRKRQSRKAGFTNWIIYVAPSLLKAILEARGLHVGAKNCIIRPHTQIQRCRRCQELTHNDKFCTAAITCANCGENHDEADCQKRSSCINCQKNNRENRTRYPTQHKTSDPVCPSYMEAYSQERERLDDKYGNNQEERGDRTEPRTQQRTEPKISSHSNTRHQPPQDQGRNNQQNPRDQQTTTTNSLPPQQQSQQQQPNHSQPQSHQQQNHRPQLLNQCRTVNTSPKEAPQELRPFNRTPQNPSSSYFQFTALPQRTPAFRFSRQELFLPDFQTHAQPAPQPFPEHGYTRQQHQSSFPFPDFSGGYLK